MEFQLITIWGTVLLTLALVLGIHFVSRLLEILNLTQVDMTNYHMCVSPIQTLVPWLAFQNKLEIRKASTSFEYEIESSKAKENIPKEILQVLDIVVLIFAVKTKFTIKQLCI